MFKKTKNTFPFALALLVLGMDSAFGSTIITELNTKGGEVLNVTKTYVGPISLLFGAIAAGGKAVIGGGLMECAKIGAVVMLLAFIVQAIPTIFA